MSQPTAQGLNPYANLPSHSSRDGEELPYGRFPKIEMAIRIAISLLMSAAVLVVGMGLLEADYFSIEVAIVCALVIAICMRILYAKRVTFAKWMAQISGAADAVHYQAICRFESGDVHGAIDDLTKLLQQAPEQARARSHRGILHFNLGNYQACVDDCSAAEASGGDWNDNRVILGFSYEKLGQWESAEATFDRVLLDDNESASSLAGRAAIRLATHRIEFAFEDVSRAHQIKPDDPYVLCVYVDVLNRLQRFEDAMPAAERLAEIDPNNLHLWLRVCESAIGIGDVERAQQAIEHAEAISPSVAATWTFKGLLQMELGDHKKAVNAFQRVLELGPADPTAVGQLGFARHLAGDSSAGLKDLDEAIKLAPEDTSKAILLNNRGFVQQSEKQFAAAEQDFQSAIECDPRHPNAYKNWAWQLATCDDAAFRDGPRSVELASHALELSQWQAPEWLGILAAAHARAGDFEKAIEYESQRGDQAAPERLAAYQCGQAWQESAD